MRGEPRDPTFYQSYKYEGKFKFKVVRKGNRFTLVSIGLLDREIKGKSVAREIVADGLPSFPSWSYLYSYDE